MIINNLKKFYNFLKEANDKQILWESSLNRIYQTMKEHDTGFISGFRSTVCKNGKIVEVTREQNLKRNDVARAILTKKYHLTSVRGKYIEKYNTPEAKEVGEDSFFVVDFEDLGTLKNDLKELGEQLQQDSIMFVPYGGETGYVIGTTKPMCGQPSPWPGYGNEEVLGDPVFGASGQFMTKVKGRPFLFREGQMEEYKKDYPRGYFGELGRYAFIENWLKENKK